jgi:hypothetical protein
MSRKNGLERLKRNECGSPFWSKSSRFEDSNTLSSICSSTDFQQPCRYQPCKLSPMFENNHNGLNLAKIGAEVVS